MSDSEHQHNEVDPDYATAGPSNEAHRKLYEETARTNVARKITAIVEKEFSKEIESKEKEILQIEGRLHKALKTLHFLRYVIITDYYNRKQCQLPQNAAEAVQTQIHPAIKQMLGKAPIKRENSIDEPGTSGTATLSSDKDSITSLEINKRLGNIDDACRDSKDVTTKNKRNLEDWSNCGNEGPPKKVPRYVPPKSGVPEPQVPSRGARHKVRKRIVIGNISKWIPPDWREDPASHKWTMYVRGSKENPDIAHFVEKVRFFLHPSYRPNDVVQVTSPPFHLSRRGWGEFPLRVQLHFKSPLNKPMDVIHHLKLDRTYTGLQTLGSETVVDVWIKTSTETSSSIDSKPFYDTELSDKLTIKQEPLDNDQTSYDCTDREITDFLGKIKQEIKEDYDVSSHVYLEHDYANFSNEDRPEIENNVTISHSPPRNMEIDENVPLNGLSLKCENYTEDGRKSSEVTVKGHESSAKSMDNRTLKIFNGNHATPQEFSASGENGKPEVRIESCESNGVSPVNESSESKNFEATKLQPLMITIPPTFEVLRGSLKKQKQIFLMKNDRLVPVNSINFENSTNSTVASALSTVVSDSIMPNSPKIGKPRATMSLLKKSANGKSSSSILKFNSTNSLILNSTNNIPALKIAEPTTNDARGSSFEEIKTQTNPSSVGTSVTKKITNDSGVLGHWLDNHKPSVKPKVTLGKDRIGATSKLDTYKQILRSIDEARITDVPALIRFIVRRIPLITEKATDPEYRTLHSYATSSAKEFLNSNIGKQRALEWFRAKRVKSFLKKKGIPDEQQWSIKEIIIWTRYHGHTPMRTLPNLVGGSKDGAKKVSDKNVPSDESETTLCTFTEPTSLLEYLSNARDSKLARDENDVAEEEIIDVEDCSNVRDQKAEKGTVDRGVELISMGVPEKIVALQSYVCETTRQIGIKLEPEEIVPGVMHCAPARILVRAVQCFIEDLLRSSLAKAWERTIDSGCPDTIALDDVRGAILQREEFDVFTNEGLGSHHCPDD